MNNNGAFAIFVKSLGTASCLISIIAYLPEIGNHYICINTIILSFVSQYFPLII
jgi:hypothetical protein